MKSIAVISIFLTVSLLGCQVKKREEPIPPPSSAETDSRGEQVLNTESEEIGQAMAPALEETIELPQETQNLVSLWSKKVREDFKWYSETGRKNGPLYYLYVTDSKENPVPNLNCYTRANWESGLQGAEHLRGTSMKSGLLPVVLSFREAERDSVELVIVDPNSGETLLVEMNLLETGWRYALHTIWEKETPDEPDKVADCIEISVLFPNGTPVSNAVVELPDIQAFRFSNLEGKVFFPANNLQGRRTGFSIIVRDYLESFQEGENWSETFSADISNSRQYFVMLKDYHS